MIVIPLENIPTLNQHDNANRANRFGGASMKKKATDICSTYVEKAMNEGFELVNEKPMFHLIWHVKDRRTDKDNISFADKYIYDGMVDAGLLPNDGFNNLGDLFVNEFKVDRDNPRVEIVEIETQKEENQIIIKKIKKENAK